MIFSEAKLLYIPFLLLSIVATIIASQAMISGIFSIIYQGITTRIMPLLRIEYTSALLRSQIYIDIVNWMLLCAVLFIIIVFRSSSNLTQAYGLAVSGTMALTSIMIVWIFVRRGEILKTIIASGVLLVTFVFLIANMHKIPYGGYWSLIIAAIPFAIILIYVNGQKNLGNALRPVPLDEFLPKFNEVYSTMNRISGSALYFARDFRRIRSIFPGRCSRTISFMKRISSSRSSAPNSRLA